MRLRRGSLAKVPPSERGFGDAECDLQSVGALLLLGRRKLEHPFLKEGEEEEKKMEGMTSII
jgi:hypothetical protein